MVEVDGSKLKPKVVEGGMKDEDFIQRIS